MSTTTKPEPSLGELFGQLAQDTGSLVRQEVQLAKVEITNKVTTAGRNVGFIAAGGALALAGFLVLLAAAVAGLGVVIPVWAAALIVGVVVMGIGYALMMKGMGALHQLDPIPERTVQTMKDNQAWVKEQMP